MSLQNMFNVAVKGLSSQDFNRSMDEHGGACMFRGAHGLKCAIGHCLNDDEICMSPGGLEIVESTNHFAALKYNVPLDDVLRLQACHDRASPYDRNMKTLLITFAADNRLELPDELK